MPTSFYSWPALASIDYPVFRIIDWSDLTATVDTDFTPSLSNPHSQGPKGGDPFTNLRPGEKISFSNVEYFDEVEELFDGRTGTSFSSDMVREFTRRFRVKIKDGGRNTVGPSTACSCPGIPLPYAPYIPQRVEEWDKQALAVNISAAQEKSDDWATWIVTVKYSTNVPASGPMFLKAGLGNALSGPQCNPWEEPASIEADIETETAYPNQDLDGKAYTNAADQPFTPAYGHHTGYRVYTITRNERVEDFENRPEDYVYVVNSNPFKGYPRGYALCTGGRGPKLWRGTTSYYRVTYKVACKKRVMLPDGTFSAGWQPRILNAGMFQKKTLFGIDDVIGETLVPITLFGHQVTQPILLNANGTKQSDKFPDDYVVVALRGKLKPVWLDFRQFREVDLNDLILF